MPLALDLPDALTLLARAALALSALVVVPLCLPLTARAHRDRPIPEVPLGTPTVVGAAVCLAAALLVQPGWVAAALTLPWVGVAAWLGLWGLRRLTTRSRVRLEELAIDVGLLHLPIGAAWAFAYRADLSILGFSGTQALLTANHFHVAGFGACVIAGLVGRSISPTSAALRAVWRVAAVTTISGILTLALGITFSAAIERFAALALSTAVTILGVQLCFLAAGRGGVRPQRAVSRLLFGVAGVSAMFAMHHALRFALVGFASLDGATFRQMVLEHGLVNTVGFVLCAVLGFRLSPPLSQGIAAGIPFSRLAAKGRVGPRFFEDAGLVDGGGRAPVGLTDSFGEFTRADLAADECADEVRAFYEDTARHWLSVRADWAPAFRPAGLLWHALARRFGQLAIPVEDASESGAITSRILPIRDDADGRTSVRAWVRTHRAPGGGEGEVIYVAAYSSHVAADVRYMNIAFPLPRSNMTSVLHLSSLGRAGGVRLTTRGPTSDHDGDEGVWCVTPLGAFRLPLDETIDVWSARLDTGWEGRIAAAGAVPAAGCTVLATHDMWMFGLRYVRLTYFIGPTSPQSPHGSRPPASSPEGSRSSPAG